MTYLKAILLGLVQGIAEFLPISSSGHLAIARNLLNMEGAGSIPEFFDVLLHLGTLIAVFAAYWSDIRDMWWSSSGASATWRTAAPPYRCRPPAGSSC